MEIIISSGMLMKSFSFYRKLTKHILKDKVRSNVVLKKSCKMEELILKKRTQEKQYRYYSNSYNRFRREATNNKYRRLSEWLNIYSCLFNNAKIITDDYYVNLEDWKFYFRRAYKEIKDNIRSLLFEFYSMTEKHLFIPHSIVETYIHICEKEKYSYHWLYIMSYRQAIFRSLI